MIYEPYNEPNKVTWAQIKPYHQAVVAAIRQIARSGHIDLCEGFAARICEACFADPRVGHIRAEVEKLDIFADAEAVGAIVERNRPV